MLERSSEPAHGKFLPGTVHKRDAFSETISGHMSEAPATKVVLRRLSGVSPWLRPLAWSLARKEIRGLRAVEGIAGTPTLLRVDREGLLRTWSEGMPLNLAKPKNPAFYRDAARLLAQLRRRGITHNDLAKPQNWLMAPDGHAEIIDFQLATVHRRKGLRYRLMAYEDLRHLLKQKRKFARHLLTPTEKRLLARRSLPSRIWMATGKRLYNFVTRRLFDWSDGEGAGDRFRKDGPAIRDALLAHPHVHAVALSPFSLPARGVGIYAFVVSTLPETELRSLAGRRIELLQPVKALPLHADGTPREDLLELIAMNRLDELEAILTHDPEMRAVVEPIVAERLNLTDRRLREV
ncbi:serine/threonine protein kinase [Poseidonocella pacifica]|uniref:Serine/threonine protein kinase n=1 Tax=Poseidonocella pacifica TaxID=871651 RepID=A0A1I0XCW5_9RHOB|nr:phosphotransferase [Poseidonocella pacifica]SFA98724.1 serine/threonine protein kinase [Poseidonocella pacifica]